MHIVSELLAELSTFPGREQDLRRVTRWSLWHPMFYRPNLLSHSKKVAWLVARVADVVTQKLGPHFDVKRALVLALVHDDPEIITGDYQAGNKAKMSPAQLAVIDAQERVAIAELSERYPKTIGGFSYQELQEDVQDLKTSEARVAKFLDLIDGFGEGIHELYAGNSRFTDLMVNEFGEIPFFDNLNIRRRTEMMKRYPELAALKDSHVFFEISPSLDWSPIVSTRSPYTLQSLRMPVGYPQYDLWKQIILDSGDAEEIANLYVQKEVSLDPKVTVAVG